MITTLTDSQWESLLNAWRAQNDAGNGEPFAVEGEDGAEYEADTVADVIDHSEVSLFAERGSGMAQQAIISCGDANRIMMVCDANGPWLCEVTNAWREIAA